MPDWIPLFLGRGSDQSFLSFFLSIFAAHLFRFAALSVAVLRMIWCIVQCAVIIFQRRPVHTAWDLSLAFPERCQSVLLRILSVGILSVGLDIESLLHPIFMIQDDRCPSYGNGLLKNCKSFKTVPFADTTACTR